MGLGDGEEDAMETWVMQMVPSSQREDKSSFKKCAVESNLWHAADDGVPNKV